jgi:hypothetical protein
MPESQAALNVLLFLLPGFVSQWVQEYLAAHRLSSDVATVRDALIFALVNYLFYSVLVLSSHLLILSGSYFPTLPSMPTIYVSAGGELDLHARQVEGLVALLLVSLVTGGTTAKFSEGPWLHKKLQVLRLTRKNSQLDVWYDTFSEFRGHWCRVCFKDGGKVTGWVYFFSDDPEKRELFLAEAYVEYPDGKSGELEGPGVLIPHAGEITWIEVIDGGRQDNNRAEGGTTDHTSSDPGRDNQVTAGTAAAVATPNTAASTTKRRIRGD